MSQFLNPTLAVLREHSVVYLHDIAYYIRNRVEAELSTPAFLKLEGTLPAVVVNIPKDGLSVDGLENMLDKFEASDDVFNSAFRQQSVIIVQHLSAGKPSEVIPQGALTFLERGRLSMSIFIDSQELPEGPYFLRNHRLHQAWRLYPDENLAFVTPVMPSDSDEKYRFQPLHASAYSASCPVVAVPSRLYSCTTPEKPLMGMRVSIKDNYHLAGVKTSAGSRSYTTLYGPQAETSEIVKQLLDKGAIIVGKTKLGAYAGSEVPPEKCIDYFPPWNPRGDGYQGPSGSSSGAGSSIASYPWLDLALGTDSTGSIRMPAASYGLWGLRSSWGILSTQNILPNVVKFDTVGVLARSPEKITDLLSTSGAFERRKWPKRLLYPTDWFPMRNEAQQKMIESFVTALEDVLGVSRIEISLEREWALTGPEDLRGLTLERFLDESIFWPNYYDGYHNWDQFRIDHQAKFGYPPYASPFMTKRWALADDITPEDRDRGFEEIEIYRNWINTYILRNNEDEQVGSIMLLPLGRPGANYRDNVPGPGGQFLTSAYDSMDLSSILGLPQLVIPIGQNKYESKVTKGIEYAPIVASIVGSNGTDLTLIEVAQKTLEKAKWPIEVLTGKNAFVPGDNIRNVAQIGE